MLRGELFKRGKRMPRVECWGANWQLEIKNQHAELQANAQNREKKIKRKEVKLNK